MGLNCNHCLDHNKVDQETNLNLYLQTIQEEESHQKYTTELASGRIGSYRGQPNSSRLTSLKGEALLSAIKPIRRATNTKHYESSGSYSEDEKCDKANDKIPGGVPI